MRGAFISAVIAVLPPCAALASDGDSAAWRTVAERSLMSALTEAYPHVTQWSVEPLLGKRQETRLADLDPFRADVVRVGKRSAVRLMRDGARASTVVWFAVRGMQALPSARTDIRAQTALVPELCEEVVHDALALTCSPVASPAALAGMRAARTIRAGEAICSQSLEPRPAVSRGEDVTVISTSGAVQIVGRGVAQQDGIVGQVLRVRNPSSGEFYSAAVSGEREVVVHD
jgi:flagella basal body P-ring formation protein FlgA